MKYVYSFKEGNKDMREILGGKGANLAEMTNLSLPVPRGFTVSTEACTRYYNDGRVISSEIETQIFEKLRDLEILTGKKFGDTYNPLLVSVRSGARASMPGMMDTILNLGMNDKVSEAFSAITNNPRFVYDSYRRFIQMFADVVMNFPKSNFEYLFDEIKKKKNVLKDTDLTADDLKEIVAIYKEQYRKLAGGEFPQDPKTQLILAIGAVFRSWENDRAKTYRRLNNIPDNWGTAVNVQEMVYGNKGENSGTGVAFTRNPATGEKKLFGEYLMNAQGEDVVAGIRTPKSIDTLKDTLPQCYMEFERICDILENHYKDMQDMEFTIEDGKLFMLQTRNAKRTAKAAIKVAVDMVNEGKITKEEAIMMVDSKTVDQLLHKTFDKDELARREVVAHGLAASPGAASGRIYFSAGDVSKMHDEGLKDIILVREETSPEDIEGMNIANGILTVRGGMTSHAAVVARGMGKCCVSGCNDIIVDSINKTIKFKDIVLHEGDIISLDGSTGNVYIGTIKSAEANIEGEFRTFMNWVDSIRTLEVRANADTPLDAITARNFGAEGIGLCRTEHMFFEPIRIFNFRKMICATTKEARIEALNVIMPYQRQDFEGLFKAMDGKTVTIRYLDPPLHEFLPKTEKEITNLAASLNIEYNALVNKINSLKEFNPMMGHRGCRLAITYPEIPRMQTRAVIEAAINVKRAGVIVKPEIMIPLVGDLNEFRYVKDIVIDEARKVMSEQGVNIEYKIGTMIEVPRATLIADKLAKEAEFFSFGTNDLTQLVYGFSRDDSSKFLNDYYDKNIFTNDPFQSIDEDGVGKFVEIGARLGRMKRTDIELGICGEHGGDQKSIEFCNRIGLNYVSCSPYRVVGARIAAAQAAIKANQK